MAVSSRLSKADFDVLMGSLTDEADIDASSLARSLAVWENVNFQIGLIVADKTDLTDDENAVKTTLEKLYRIEVIDDDDVDSGDMDFSSLFTVIVSPQVDSAKLGALTPLAIPIFCYEPVTALTILKMGSTAGGEGTAYGTATNQTQIDIINNHHPISIERSLGPFTVYTSPSSVYWIKNTNLVADAVQLSTIVDDSAKITCAVLPFEGTNQDGDPSPSIRVFIGVYDSNLYTDDFIECIKKITDWLGDQIRVLTVVQALEKSKTIQDMLGRGDFTKTKNLYDYLVTGTTGSTPFEVISEYESRSVMERLE